MDLTAFKIEAFTAVVANLGKMFKMVLEAQQGGRQPRNTGLWPVSASRSTCNFCSGCKGVHSLMLNLGHVMDSDGFVRNRSGFHQRYEQTRWNKRIGLGLE